MNLTENQTRRVVVVSGVPDVLPCSRMKDKLFIHFQSSKSHGGDVDDIQYPTNLDGVAFVIFDRVQDARKVVAQEQQILKDKDFPQDYLLTVYDFTPNVFFYSTAVVDLSIFHHQGADCLPLLLQSLQSLHRSVRITGSPSGAASVSVEGPFEAVRALREDLMSRAGVLGKGAPLSEEEVTMNAPYEQTRDLPGGKAWWLKSRGGAWVNVDGGSNRLAHSDREVGPCSLSVLEYFGPSSIKGPSIKPYSLESEGTYPGGPDPVSSAPSLSPRGSPPTSMRAALEMEALTQRTDSGRRADATEYYSLSEPAISTQAAVGNRTPARLHGDTSSPSAPYERETPRHLQRQPQEESSGWVDTNTLLYVRRCRGDALDTCLSAHDVKARYDDAGDLTEVILSGGEGNASDPRAVQTALTNLMLLVDYWQSVLRIYTIDCDKYAPDEWRRVSEICKNVNGRLPEVLCLETGSSIKIIGSSASSHLFHEGVMDQINMLLKR